VGLRRRPCNVEHSAYGGAIDGNDLHGETDNASRELIHHDHDPVGLEQDGFAAEEVGAPQAIGPGPQPGEPRRAAAASIGTVMLGKNTAWRTGSLFRTGFAIFGPLHPSGLAGRRLPQSEDFRPYDGAVYMPSD